LESMTPCNQRRYKSFIPRVAVNNSISNQNITISPQTPSSHFAFTLYQTRPHLCNTVCLYQALGIAVGVDTGKSSLLYRCLKANPPASELRLVKLGYLNDADIA
jgi:hypothetical protein